MAAVRLWLISGADSRSQKITQQWTGCRSKHELCEHFDSVGRSRMSDKACKFAWEIRKEVETEHQ